MKVNQFLVTKTFQIRNGTSGLYNDPNDVKRIQEVLQKNYGVFISESEAIDFWKYRCNEWDSSWMSPHNEGEILDWFQKFIEFVYGPDDKSDDCDDCEH
jgi:hypothetical protein